MEYRCINNDCGLALDVKAGKDNYICPSCGNSMFDSKLINKVKKNNSDLFKGFNSFKNQIDEEKLEALIKQEQKIKRQAEKKGLRKVKNYILAFINMIKDPDADMKHKIVAAAALLYIVNPVDIIPDIIPGIGYADDTIMVMIAAGILQNTIKKYMNSLENPRVYNQLFYLIYPNNTKLPYRYSEDNGIRVLNLYPHELDRFGLSTIDGGLAKPSELYLGHPYFYKTLIPYKDYDNYIAGDIINEEINLLTALGAKRVEYTVHNFEQNSKKLDLDIDIEQIINGNANAESKGLKYSSQSRFIEFEDNNHINVDEINNLIWYFTGEGNINKLFKKRLLNRLKKYNFESYNSTENHLNLEARTKLKETLKIGGNFAKSNVIYQKVSFAVDFYSLPDKYYNKPQEKFKQIKKLLAARKEELKKNIYGETE